MKTRANRINAIDRRRKILRIRAGLSFYYMQFLRHVFVRLLIVIYVAMVFIYAAFGTKSGLHWPNASRQFYRAARDLPINTRISEIDVKRPTIVFTSQFWNVPDFEHEMKGLYTTTNVKALSEIDPATLSAEPKIHGTTIAIPLGTNRLLQRFLNAGSKVIVCDSSKTCTLTPNIVEAIYCDSSTPSLCYVAIDTTSDSKDIAALKKDNLQIIPVNF
jgi:hypothetical protein